MADRKALEKHQKEQQQVKQHHEKYQYVVDEFRGEPQQGPSHRVDPHQGPPTAAPAWRQETRQEDKRVREVRTSSGTAQTVEHRTKQQVEERYAGQGGSRKKETEYLHAERSSTSRTDPRLQSGSRVSQATKRKPTRDNWMPLHEERHLDTTRQAPLQLTSQQSGPSSRKIVKPSSPVRARSPTPGQSAAAAALFAPQHEGWELPSVFPDLGALADDDFADSMAGAMGPEAEFQPAPLHTPPRSAPTQPQAQLDLLNEDLALSSSSSDVDLNSPVHTHGSTLASTSPGISDALLERLLAGPPEDESVDITGVTNPARDEWQLPPPASPVRQSTWPVHTGIAPPTQFRTTTSAVEPTPFTQAGFGQEEDPSRRKMLAMGKRYKGRPARAASAGPGGRMAPVAQKGPRDTSSSRAAPVAQKGPRQTTTSRSAAAIVGDIDSDLLVSQTLAETYEPYESSSSTRPPTETYVPYESSTPPKQRTPAGKAPAKGKRAPKKSGLEAFSDPVVFLPVDRYVPAPVVPAASQTDTPKRRVAQISAQDPALVAKRERLAASLEPKRRQPVRRKPLKAQFTPRMRSTWKPQLLGLEKQAKRTEDIALGPEDPPETQHRRMDSAAEQARRIEQIAMGGATSSAAHQHAIDSIEEQARRIEEIALGQPVNFGAEHGQRESLEEEARRIEEIAFGPAGSSDTDEDEEDSAEEQARRIEEIALGISGAQPERLDRMEEQARRIENIALSGPTGGPAATSKTWISKPTAASNAGKPRTPNVGRSKPYGRASARSRAHDQLRTEAIIPMGNRRPEATVRANPTLSQALLAAKRAEAQSQPSLPAPKPTFPAPKPRLPAPPREPIVQRPTPISKPVESNRGNKTQRVSRSRAHDQLRSEAIVPMGNRRAEATARANPTLSKALLAAKRAEAQSQPREPVIQSSTHTSKTVEVKKGNGAYTKTVTTVDVVKAPVSKYGSRLTSISHRLTDSESSPESVRMGERIPSPPPTPYRLSSPTFPELSSEGSSPAAQSPRASPMSSLPPRPTPQAAPILLPPPVPSAPVSVPGPSARPTAVARSRSPVRSASPSRRVSTAVGPLKPYTSNDGQRLMFAPHVREKKLETLLGQVPELPLDLLKAAALRCHIPESEVANWFLNYRRSVHGEGAPNVEFFDSDTEAKLTEQLCTRDRPLFSAPLLETAERFQVPVPALLTYLYRVHGEYSLAAGTKESNVNGWPSYFLGQFPNSDALRQHLEVNLQRGGAFDSPAKFTNGRVMSLSKQLDVPASLIYAWWIERRKREMNQGSK